MEHKYNVIGPELCMHCAVSERKRVCAHAHWGHGMGGYVRLRARPSSRAITETERPCTCVNRFLSAANYFMYGHCELTSERYFSKIYDAIVKSKLTPLSVSFTFPDT